MQANTVTPKKKVLIETWGCQMNVADSEQMISLLEDESYEQTDSPEDADLVLLNTCHIREKAKHKVVSRLGRLSPIKKKRPSMKIAVAGCVAQAEGKKLLKEAPCIDVLLGPGKIKELPNLLKENDISGGQTLSIGFKEKDKESGKKIPIKTYKIDVNKEKRTTTITGKNDISRFVNIAQGCNNFCTYCVVPFTRGKEISRSQDEIVENSKSLIMQGAKEITLLGQNVNSYGLDLIEDGNIEMSERGPFVDLLDRVSQIDGLHRLRFTSSNPHDFTKPIADLFASRKSMGKYMHLPAQSGNDRILEAMKRKVTVEGYMEKVHWLREAVPDMAISTDLIVGFPSETEEEFEGTLELIKNVDFCFSYAFAYSTRPNTAAARFKEQIDEKVKKLRLSKLNEIQNAITIRQNLEEIGQEREVLFAYESRKEPGIFYGRTEHFRLVRVKASRSVVGRSLGVKITEANKTALVGELL